MRRFTLKTDMKFIVLLAMSFIANLTAQVPMIPGSEPNDQPTKTLTEKESTNNNHTQWIIYLSHLVI